MYDQQLAVSMSREGGGIGLADVLMRRCRRTSRWRHTAAARSPAEAARPAAGGAAGRRGASRVGRGGLRGRKGRDATTWR
jgi:flagellar protein FlgJ